MYYVCSIYALLPFYLIRYTAICFGFFLKVLFKFLKKNLPNLFKFLKKIIFFIIQKIIYDLFIKQILIDSLIYYYECFEHIGLIKFLKKFTTIKLIFYFFSSIKKKTLFFLKKIKK